MTAFRARLRAKLHNPVRMGKDLRVMVNQQDRIAVGDQIVHHPR